MKLIWGFTTLLGIKTECREMVVYHSTQTVEVSPTENPMNSLRRIINANRASLPLKFIKDQNPHSRRTNKLNLVRPCRAKANIAWKTWVQSTTYKNNYKK